jgi:hypothetical protein
MGRQSPVIAIALLTALAGAAVDARAQADGPTAPQRSASERQFIPIPPRPVPPSPIPPRPPGDGWVWVPPTYRTVYERVWQEPVYREVTEQAWVPDEYGWRTVDCWEDGTLVRRQVWTVVRPGYWTTVTRRELVSPGGWVYRARRELVTPGHWEWRGGVEPPPPTPIPQPAPRPTPAPRPPGLEPFSPLWEWPDDKPKG